jgi:hypothetical protein
MADAVQKLVLHFHTSSQERERIPCRSYQRSFSLSLSISLSLTHAHQKTEMKTKHPHWQKLAYKTVPEPITLNSKPEIRDAD